MLLWFYSLTLYTWIRGYLRRADQNQDGKMSYDEVKRLLQMINIDLSEHYARSLFKVRVVMCTVCEFLAPAKYPQLLVSGCNLYMLNAESVKCKKTGSNCTEMPSW